MTPRHARGFTLIEVLVAILIFSFGLLGFVGLQARSVQFSTDAENRNRAALLANDLAATVTLDTTTATATLPADAWDAWLGRVRTALPQASAATAAPQPNVLTLTISWVPPGAASGAQASRYTTQIVTNP